MKSYCPGQWIQCVSETTLQKCFSNKAGFQFFWFVPVSARRNMGIHKHLDVNIL